MGTPSCVAVREVCSFDGMVLCLILTAPHHKNCTPLLQELHWLPISEWLKSKTACMCYNAITGSTCSPPPPPPLLSFWATTSLQSFLLFLLFVRHTHLKLQRFNCKTHAFALCHISAPSSGTIFPKTSGTLLLSQLGNIVYHTGPRSAAVSASDCGSEGLGFESHQSHVGFFGPGRLLPRAGSAMGPVGRLEPHSRASSTSRMRLWGCCSDYLTNTAGAAVPGPG